MTTRAALTFFLTLTAGLSLRAGAASAERPLMRDFMGLNTHTVQFKPELYGPVATLVRDYHPVQWDFGQAPGTPVKLPMAQNGVDWDRDVYGKWKAAGQRTDASLLFDDLKPEAWKNPEAEAEAYGKAFAAALGPSSAKGLVEAVEVGNEPGLYDDALYRKIFTGMARGLRAGDAKLKIATCAVDAGKSGRYHKSLDCVKGLEAAYDVINIHSYAELEGWPTWRRSHPEDARLDYLKKIERVAKWRDENAPGKPVWLTEFGWDACAHPELRKGDFAKWETTSEPDQARWIVRTWLLTAALPVERAYLYWFNDKDEPQVHGSSGLTRNYVPKPSYHAAVWLQKELGAFRFTRVLKGGPDVWAYEFTHETGGKKAVAIWRAVGNPEPVAVPELAGGVSRAEVMPLSAGEPKTVEVKDGKVTVGVDPVLVFGGK